MTIQLQAHQTPMLTTQSLMNCYGIVNACLNSLRMAHLSLESRLHDPGPIQVLITRSHLYHAIDWVVGMRCQVPTGPSCIFRIRKCHESRRYRGIRLDAPCAILSDESSQEIEFFGEVVNFRRGVSMKGEPN